MTVAETVIQKVLAMPPDKQAQVLEFVQNFEASPVRRTRTPFGAAAQYPFKLSFAEFQELRREMWGTSTDRELDRDDP